MKITGVNSTIFVNKVKKATTMKTVKKPILKDRGFFLMSSFI